MTIYGVQIADARHEYDDTWRKRLLDFYTHIYREKTLDSLILCYHDNHNIFVDCLPTSAWEIDLRDMFETELIRNMPIYGAFPLVGTHRNGHPS